MNLINPVTRNVAGDCAPGAVLADLVNWSGVPLMLHRHVANQAILGAPQWTCSHEPTGYAIAHGPSPETALAAAIVKIRTNGLLILRELTCQLPVLNP